MFPARVLQTTGAAKSVQTGADGTYAAGDLSPGAYTVTVALAGFRKVAQKDHTLAPGGSLTVDLILETAALEETLTVTAMLREHNVADVPFSIAAPSEEALRARGVDNLESLAPNVAGLSVQNLGPGRSQVAMRGASAGQIARDEPGVKEQVGAYLDDSVISFSLFTPDLDLFDISRVEVLRGPQGTLFGSGSLSGTVRYISNLPELGARGGSRRSAGARSTAAASAGRSRSDHVAGIGTVDLLSFGPNTIGGPLTASTFTFDPELPAYDIVNLRLGLRRDKWEAALYANNLADERAFLALDRERGTRARVGYLTNTPRTFGVTTRFTF